MWVHIDLFNNVITFRKKDATLNLPTFDFGYDGDIYLEFETTIDNGILVYSERPEDEIRIELQGIRILYFQFREGRLICTNY